MIKTFKCKETEKLFRGQFSARLPQAIQRTAAIKLKILNAISVLETLRVPPSNHLEASHHDREGQYSIRLNRAMAYLFCNGSGVHSSEVQGVVAGKRFRRSRSLLK
jgi:toxin HigB-1